MAANAINNFFGTHSHNLGMGLGAFGSLGLDSSTKPPQLERYHEEHHEWAPSKGSSKSKKGNVALSALTLLAFLFFLHILQNCIQEHMVEIKDQKGTNGNTTINLPNMIVLGTGSRDNLKGDDGLLPLTAEELSQYSPSQQIDKKPPQAQNRMYKQRNKNNQQKRKHKNRNGPAPAKSEVHGVVYPLDSTQKDIPMHRIDNIP